MKARIQDLWGQEVTNWFSCVERKKQTSLAALLTVNSSSLSLMQCAVGGGKVQVMD